MFFVKQKTAYEMCGRDWSSDVCSSGLEEEVGEEWRRNGGGMEEEVEEEWRRNGGGSGGGGGGGSERGCG